jgi:ribosomal protein S17E
MLTDLPANKRVIIYILLKYFSSILKDYESNKSKSIKEIIKPYFDHVKEGYIQKNKRKRDQ